MPKLSEFLKGNEENFGISYEAGIFFFGALSQPAKKIVERSEKNFRALSQEIAINEAALSLLKKRA